MTTAELKTAEEKMKKAISALKVELSHIRAGRANPAILDKVMVEYYGALTPINQLANISVPEARMIVIQPWDSKLIREIEKAIQKSDIGINPSNDGKIIRLVFPIPTEERRKELIKEAKKLGEETKIVIRIARRETIEVFRSLKKDSEITEDDLKNLEKEVQTLTDKYVAETDEVVQEKSDEILEI